MSFENVCAHGQIHKEGCKPRLRPGSREGPLHSVLNFTPCYRENSRERGREREKARTLLYTSPVFPPFLSVSSLRPVAAMCVRVSCQGSDPRTNILALFEERELLRAARVAPVTHTNGDRSIPRRVRATIRAVKRRRYSFSFRFVA